MKRERGGTDTSQLVKRKQKTADLLVATRQLPLTGHPKNSYIMPKTTRLYKEICDRF